MDQDVHRRKRRSHFKSTLLDTQELTQHMIFCGIGLNPPLPPPLLPPWTALAGGGGTLKGERRLSLKSPLLKFPELM